LVVAVEECDAAVEVSEPFQQVILHLGHPVWVPVLEMAQEPQSVAELEMV
jgi:hypothetical protein